MLLCCTDLWAKQKCISLIKQSKMDQKKKRYKKFILVSFLFSGEALDCIRCVSRKAGGACERSVETCKPEKDACAAAKFLTPPSESLPTVYSQKPLNHRHLQGHGSGCTQTAVKTVQS